MYCSRLRPCRQSGQHEYPPETDLSAHSQAYLNKGAQLPVDVGKSRFEDITDWLPRAAVELN